jgi:oxalate decarboxylase/phosphoglucose isomerase-like protein (cupin superfamily)
MSLRVVSHVRITTKDESGAANGFLVPIYNVHDAFPPAEHRPQQVYLTVCAPGAAKGPHLHMKRWGYFTCIKGNARIVVKTAEGYESAWTGEAHAYATVEVPAGIPAMIENAGAEDAYVLNMPSPAWTADDTDEHPVEGWDKHPLPPGKAG